MAKKRQGTVETKKQSNLLQFFGKKLEKKPIGVNDIPVEIASAEIPVDFDTEEVNFQDLTSTGNEETGKIPMKMIETEEKKAQVDDNTSANTIDREKREIESILSEYEVERMKKMKQNQAFLISLGINRIDSSKLDASKQVIRKKTKPIERNLPIRRSSRKMNQNQVETKPAIEIQPQVDCYDEERIKIPDTTALFDYLCEQHVLNDSTKEKESISLIHFHSKQENDRFDSNLKRIYSMDLDDSLLVSAGHNGYLSIYAKDPSYQLDPLLSFRAHTGWCSGVNLKLSTCRKSLLITTSNDAFVRLWELNRSTMSMEKVAETSQLHASGIFSVDVHIDSKYIATASKDHTVSLARTTETCIEQIQSFQYHQNVVKCVRFSHGNSNLLASCGNDHVVHIQDIRTVKDHQELNAHTRAVNSVRWCESNPNTILSSSFDGMIHVWDLRNPSMPSVTYSTSETKRMFPMEILPDSKLIVGVDQALLVYDTKVKKIYSRGDLGYEPDALYVENGSQVIVAHGKFISMFTCPSDS